MEKGNRYVIKIGTEWGFIYYKGGSWENIKFTRDINEAKVYKRKTYADRITDKIGNEPRIVLHKVGCLAVSINTVCI